MYFQEASTQNGITAMEKTVEVLVRLTALFAEQEKN